MPSHSAIRSAKSPIQEGLERPSEVSRLRAELAEMETLMIRWRIIAQRWTPGGSEYMDPDACEAFIRQQREDHTRTKLENARLRKEIEALRQERAA